MIALPWYLLAGGIILVILGSLLTVLSSSRESKGKEIDPDMDDDEIAQQLNRQQPISFPAILILIGLLLVLVSIAWRLIRWFAG